MAHKQEAALDNFTRQAIMTILHIMRNLRHSGMEMLTEVELSYPQIIVLYALMERGTVTMSELSRWLKISHGVTTRTVDRLVDKELVERRRDEGDRRVVSVSLSDEGRDFAEKSIGMQLESVSKVFKGVSRENREAFLSLLKQIDEQLED